MMRLSQKGYSCAQILILLALGAMGVENPKLVRVMEILMANGFVPFSE
jgi:hypothetical protein